jgi:hypothetical protein
VARTRPSNHDEYAHAVGFLECADDGEGWAFDGYASGVWSGFTLGGFHLLRRERRLFIAYLISQEM